MGSKNWEMYGEVDIRRLKDVSCNHVVKASACARDSELGDQIWFLLEALDCLGVIDALLCAQRAPEECVWSVSDKEHPFLLR